MNYKLIYDQLMFRATQRILHQNFDRHHILPKSFGGSNDSSNIVKLTHREHYLAHLLLLKITTGKERSKMAFALFRFSPKGSSKYGNGRTYARARKSISSALSGKNNPFYGRILTEEHRRKITGINHGMYGKNCYDIWVEKLGKAEADIKKKLVKQKRSIAMAGPNNGMYGKMHSAKRNSNHAAIMKSLTTVYKDGNYKRAQGQKLEQLLTLGWITKAEINRQLVLTSI